MNAANRRLLVSGFLFLLVAAWVAAWVLTTRTTREHYADEVTRVLVMQPKAPIRIAVPDLFSEDAVLKRVQHDLRHVLRTQDRSNADYVVGNAMDFEKDANAGKCVLAVLPQPLVLVMLVSVEQQVVDNNEVETSTLVQAAAAGKAFLCTSPAAEAALRAIYSATYSARRAELRIRQQHTTDPTRLADLLIKTKDAVLVHFVHPQKPFEAKRPASDQSGSKAKKESKDDVYYKISAIDYDGFDVHALKLQKYNSTVYSKYIDLAQHVVNYVGSKRLLRALTSDAVVMASAKDRPQTHILLHAILDAADHDARDVVARATFVGRYLGACGVADRVAAGYSAQILRSHESALHVGRSATAVLEQFDQVFDKRKETRTPAMSMSSKTHVAGFFAYDPDVPWVKNMRTGSVLEGGVPLVVGDRVKLTAQERAEENDAYYVLKVFPESSRAILSTHKRLSLSAVTVRALSESSAMLDVAGSQVSSITGFKYRLEIGDRVLLEVHAKDQSSRKYACTLVGKDAKTWTFKTEVDAPDEIYTKLARCVTDPMIKTRAECESRADVFGKPREPGVWDAPCSKDRDCPFYQANKNWPNHRGGCVDGYCEMPIGVRRVGFRKFDSTSASSVPRCHGCPENDVVACCRKQAERIKSESGKNNLATPDYAFILDEIQRTVQ